MCSLEYNICLIFTCDYSECLKEYMCQTSQLFVGVSVSHSLIFCDESCMLAVRELGKHWPFFRPFGFYTWLPAFKKKEKCTVCVAKAKALISCAVTTQLVCAFVFAYANCWFSDAAAQLVLWVNMGYSDCFGY